MRRWCQWAQEGNECDVAAEIQSAKWQASLIGWEIFSVSDEAVRLTYRNTLSVFLDISSPSVQLTVEPIDSSVPTVAQPPPPSLLTSIFSQNSLRVCVS